MMVKCSFHFELCPARLVIISLLCHSFIINKKYKINKIVIKSERILETRVRLSLCSKGKEEEGELEMILAFRA